MKKTKKRWTGLILFMVICLLFAGCGKKEEHKETEQNKDENRTEAVSEDTQTEEVDDVTLDGMSREILEGMTLEEKAGQMIITGLDSFIPDSGRAAKKLTPELISEIRALNPGGIILYSKNVKNEKALKKLNAGLQDISHIPLLIGADEEGGSNSKIASKKKLDLPETADAEAMGEMEQDEVKENGKEIGKYLADLGFNLDFAPVADLRTEESDQRLGNRSFGSEAAPVAEKTAAFVEGLKEQGVSSVLKYFPGQGSAGKDTRREAADVKRTIRELRKEEFLPFTSGIEAGTDLVMTGHVSCSMITGNDTPTSLSSLMVTEILRKELRFQSVIITDAMNMKAITDMYKPEDAAVKAVRAGNDMLLCPDQAVQAAEGIVAAVEKGEIGEDRIDESVLRILKLKIRRGIIPQDTDLVKQQ